MLGISLKNRFRKTSASKEDSKVWAIWAIEKFSSKAEERRLARIGLKLLPVEWALSKELE
jgi:hypothetical protein